MANAIVPAVSSVSPVYKELRTFTNKEYADAPPEFRDFIFAAAYTRYCSQKKEYCDRAVKGDGAQPELLRFSFRPYQNETSYRDFCQFAEGQLKAVGQRYSTDMIGLVIPPIITGLQKEIEPVASAVSDLRHRIVRPARPLRVRVGHFLIGSLVHAFHIVIAAIMILALAWLLRHVPPVADWLDELGRHYVGPLLTHDAPGGTTSVTPPS